MKIHLLEKGRRGIAAGEGMALDRFQEAFGQQSGAGFPGFAAKILRQRRMRH